jgi:uncharacterized membrane protein HdeD (DUF308 family)
MSVTTAATFVKNSAGWSIGLSILMIVAGALAIASPLAAGIAVNLVVAWLLLFSGCAHLVFEWHARSAGGFLWELLLGILYIFTGGYLLMHPLAGLQSLTIVLAIYLFFEAVLEFVLGFAVSPVRGSGWILVDGIITSILALMIWKTWPSNTGWAVGTLVGVSMLFSGTSRLIISLGARRLTDRLA